MSSCQWMPFKQGQGLRLSVALTLNNRIGVIELRNDPTPELDRVPRHPLGEQHPGAIYLQPKGKA